MFVDRNSMDPELGLVGQVVVEVDATGARRESDLGDYWSGVPWSTRPRAFEALSNGRSLAFDVEGLTGGERDLHERSPEAASSYLVVPIFVEGTWVGTLGFGSKAHRDWTQADERLLQTAAGMIGAYWRRRESDRTVESMLRQKERSAEYHHALALCAEALLSPVGEGALERALGALLGATESDFIFLGQNVGVGAHMALRNVLSRSREGTSLPAEDLRTWDLVPWSDMPTSREHLEHGRPFSFTIGDLSGREREFYDRSHSVSQSVLKIPVFAESRWSGVVGFSRIESTSHWSPDDIGLLETAASMIGSYWATEERRERLAAALGEQQRRTRLEHAVAEVARTLLMETGDDALEEALHAMVQATETSYAFVNRCDEDPVLGPVVDSVCAVAAEGLQVRGEDAEYWQRVPWSVLTSAYEKMLAGTPHAFAIDDLSGAERQFYANAPTKVRAELKIPIFVSSRLEGVVGFSDVRKTRRWSDDDLGILGMAAQLIGAYWERQQARMQLERLVRSKDEFVASVSHELRTPLTAVVGLSHELSEGFKRFGEDERREFVALIAEQSSEVAHIVEDLLVAARSDIGTVTVVERPTDVKGTVQQVLDGLNTDWSARLKITGPDATALADPGRLRQIMRNLITNAVRYGGPTVAIEIVQDVNSVVVSVRDDGVGIPAEARDEIFEPYVSAHDRRGQPASVGLGLTVSRDLARLMGGDLEYRYRNGWSVFELTLPVG